MKVRIGKQYPIIPSEVLLNLSPKLKEDWKFGYIKDYTPNTKWSYQVYYTLKDGREQFYPLERNEFEYVNTKPINKADWL